MPVMAKLRLRDQLDSREAYAKVRYRLERLQAHVTNNE